jgi:hypothetical protein
VPCTRYLASLHLLEEADEQAPDRLSFLLGVREAGQRLKEAVRGLDVHEIDGELVQEGGLHLLALACAHEAGVDEDGGELVADRLVDQRRRDGGVDAARERAEHVAGADLGTHGLDLRLDHRGVGPRRPAPADLEQETPEQLLSPLGVHHLGVELDPVQAAGRVLERGDRDLGGGRRDREPVGGAHDRVGVAHPHLARGGPAVHERRGCP